MSYIDQLKQLRPKYLGVTERNADKHRERFLCNSFKGCPKDEVGLVPCDRCILNRYYPEELPGDQKSIDSFLNRIIVLGD